MWFTSTSAIHLDSTDNMSHLIVLQKKREGEVPQTQWGCTQGSSTTQESLWSEGSQRFSKKIIFSSKICHFHLLFAILAMLVVVVVWLAIWDIQSWLTVCLWIKDTMTDFPSFLCIHTFASPLIHQFINSRRIIDLLTLSNSLKASVISEMKSSGMSCI